MCHAWLDTATASTLISYLEKRAVSFEHDKHDIRHMLRLMRTKVMSTDDWRLRSTVMNRTIAMFFLYTYKTFVSNFLALSLIAL